MLKYRFSKVDESNEREGKEKFVLKQAKEYRNYLKTLTDDALLIEWGKVTGELKKYFGNIEPCKKEHKSERKSSSSVTFV